MIVDLFGPPCSGKTVFASRLAMRLRQKGLDVILHVSSRGDEIGGAYETIFDRAARPGFSTLQRLWRPVLELATEATQAKGPLEDNHEVEALLRLGETGSRLQMFRFRRYVRKLAQRWRAAARRDAVTIFDQGYIQACCSALLMNPLAGDGELAKTLRSLPQADVLVRVAAPVEILEERLRQRMSGLDPVGRLLEVSIGIRQTSLADHVAAIDRLSGLLKDAGRPVRAISSDDPAAQERCIAEIARAWTGDRGRGGASEVRYERELQR